MWLILVQNCENCGSDTAAKLCKNHPTKKKVKEFEAGLKGYGYCMRTAVVEIKPDGPTVTTDALSRT